MVSTSCASTVGSMIAAACSGGTESAISGSAITPRPKKPPFERPSRVTPMTATHVEQGIGDHSGSGGAGGEAPLRLIAIKAPAGIARQLYCRMAELSRRRGLQTSHGPSQCGKRR